MADIPVIAGTIVRLTLMALKRMKRENRRPLSPTDLWINRGIGAVVLVIGAVMVYSLVFSPFNESVRFQWEVTQDGGRTPMTHITCPAPWSVLVNDAEPDVITTDGFCVMPSRSLLVEGGIVALISILIASVFFTRTTRPGPIHDLPLSRNRQERDVMS